MELIRKAKSAYIAMSVIMLILGLALVIWPEISLSVLCLTVGIVLLIFGVVKLIGYFSKDLYRLAFQFDLALGIFTLIFGIILIIHPANIVMLLPVIMGVLILLDGVFKIQTAMDARRFGMERWWAIMFLAVVTAIFGLLLVIRPFEGAVAVMVLLGITLMVDGIQNLCVVLYTVKISKQHAMERDYYKWEER